MVKITPEYPLYLSDSNDVLDRLCGIEDNEVDSNGDKPSENCTGTQFPAFSGVYIPAQVRDVFETEMDKDNSSDRDGTSTTFEETESISVGEMMKSPVFSEDESSDNSLWIDLGQSSLGSDSAGQLHKQKIASPLPPFWFSGKKNHKRPSPKTTLKIYGSPIYDDKDANLGHDDHMLSFDAAVLSVSQELDCVKEIPEEEQFAGTNITSRNRIKEGNEYSKSISYSPHFFKIILQNTIEEGKLGIPIKFATKYGSGMSSPALLRLPTGAVWEVELEKCDGKFGLTKGWKEFSNHYSLEPGHFLVFKYEGNCNFHVLIFDKSASEINYLPYTPNNHVRDLIDDISPSKNMREKSHLPCSRPYKMMKSIKTESNVKPETLAPQFRPNGSCHRIKKLTAGKKTTALQRASNAFKSEHPFFLVVMQPSYVNLTKTTCRLPIPTNFVREHLKKQDCDVNLCNSYGRTWSVSLFRQRKAYPNANLQTGWHTFVQDNYIHVGDVCAFELVNCFDMSFKVVILPSRYEICNEFHQPNPVKRIAEASYQRKGCLQQPLNTFEKAKALEKACGFTSENPFFVLVLQPSYIHTSKMSVPENFAREYFTTKLEKVTLCISNGKSWPVKYYQHSIENPSSKLTTGWKRFVLDNNLKVGDVCAFELIQGTETSLNVTIYKNRAVEDAN